MSENGDLPKSWASPAIGDVCILHAGVGFPHSLQGRSEGEVPFFKVGDISECWQRNERYLDHAKHYVSRDEAKKIRTTLLSTGSVVFAKIGAAISLNRRAILARDSLVDNNCMGLTPNSTTLDERYLFFFTCTLRLGERSRASIVPSLRKSDVELIRIPVPPLNEQRRIVAKIEELFSDLDAGVAALERAKANLKRYRAAVLKAAVEGKLTEAWRAAHPDTEPASKLLERILAERRQKWEADQLAKFATAGKQPPKNWRDKYVEPTPPETNGLPELPEGWCWASVEQLGQIQLGRQRSPSNRSDKFPTKYVRAANLTENGLNLTDVLDMEFHPQELETYRLSPGDVLLSEASGSPDQVGKPVVWNGEINDCCFQNTVIRFRPIGILSDYPLTVFKYYYRSKLFARVSSGVGINHLSAGKFAGLPFPLPTLREQTYIAGEVEERLFAIMIAERQIETNLARAVGLRQSILKQAFEGKLVPQDLNDEPASVLLERMRATSAIQEGNDREVTPAKTRGRRAKSKTTTGSADE
jgi:type I restriction enzyme S subunit